MRGYRYPKVSIIILNWNGLEDTIECLESLKKITYPNYEVIVVDNGSEGNDVEVLKEKFGDYIHIIQNDKNYGFAEGNNIAIRWLLDNSKPDYFLLLNNDTVVAPEFLTELVKVAESDERIGFIGPKTYYYNFKGRKDVINFAGGKFNIRKGQPYHIGAREVDKGQYDEIREVDYVEGSCLLVGKGVVKDIGLLSSSYFYWEENDWCLRGYKAGYKSAYVPEAKIWHKIAASSGGKVPRYYFTKNRFLFMRQHATKLQQVTSLLYFFGFQFWFTSGVLVVYYRDIKGFISFLRGTIDGLKVLLLQ
ncbi:glycosyltransferase family 2 protein [Dehalococcoidia bacterium]|nr:glycosyltransferase family 2 protein [Dehalococcoidia bacterium]